MVLSGGDRLPATPPIIRTSIASDETTEISAIPTEAWTKYRNARSYLDRAFTLPQWSAVVRSTGPTVRGYKEGKWERARDVDNRWHDFVLQERGNSCGPACVAIVKRSFHNLTSQQVNEGHIRGLVALAEKGKRHEGMSALQKYALSAHDWKNVGSNNRGLIDVLKAQPYAVPKARHAGGMNPADLLEELDDERVAVPGPGRVAMPSSGRARGSSGIRTVDSRCPRGPVCHLAGRVVCRADRRYRGCRMDVRASRHAGGPGDRAARAMTRATRRCLTPCGMSCSIAECRTKTSTPGTHSVRGAIVRKLRRPPIYPPTVTTAILGWRSDGSSASALERARSSNR